MISQSAGCVRGWIAWAIGLAAFGLTTLVGPLGIVRAQDPLPPPLAAETARTASSMSATLIPGQQVQPIDLCSVLRLAGARDLDIATARQRVCQAVADLEEARGLWLPSFFTGPTYYRLDGQVQSIEGKILTVDRSSLYLGTTASLANSFASPPPGSGFPPLNSLSGVLRLSDAIYQARAANRVIAANKAGVGATVNNSLLAAAERYLDLQQAAGTLAISREAAANSEVLANVTRTFASSGAGLEADNRRVLTELKSRRRSIRIAAGQLEIASANLVQQLVLDPRIIVAPIEPAESIVRMVPEEIPLDDLIVEGWRSRPELAQSKHLVEAAVFRQKQAQLRPFVPSLALTFAGGGFGGGQNAFFGNFNARGDFAASLFWDLRGFGLIDYAAVHRAKAVRKTADIDLVRVQAQVANDVVASYKARLAASEALGEARDAVTEALESLNLNLTNIRRGAGLPGATRPIEVLQPIQALAQARAEYLAAVIDYNRAQFRLNRALGQPATLGPPAHPSGPGPAPPIRTSTPHSSPRPATAG